MEKKKKAELLAPAGSYESMKAAFAAGADAVYIGGSRFGARAYAENLEEEMLCEAIDYAHLHGRKVYLTVNTLLKEQEIKEVNRYLLPYAERGLDGVIVQDFGVMTLIHTWFPSLPIHASTQATITGVYGAKWMKEHGASRVVTARELSLEEIRQIHQQVEIELESFVHGALCYCYSGQCLMSSLIGGRSGNRGRCAQPCRLPYEVWKNGKRLNGKNEQYLLSLKDLCTLRLLPDILEAGVYSLKIEGRMKSPRYTAGVVCIYRKYLDLFLKEGRKGYRVNPQDEQLLLDLFDRGGFTGGYSCRHNGREMIALSEKAAFREGNPQFLSWLDQKFIGRELQTPIYGKAEFIPEKEAKLTLQIRQEDKLVHECTVYGQTVQPARSQPITEEKIRRQLEKTGESPFSFCRLQIQISGNGFLPVQAVNELRRKGFDALKKEILAKPQKNKPIHQKSENPKEEKNQKKAESFPEFSPFLIASLEEANQLFPVLDSDKIEEIYLESDAFLPKKWKETVEICHQKGKRCSLMMPYIFRSQGISYFQQNLSELCRAGFDGIVVRNLEEVQWINETGEKFLLIVDASLYTWNNPANQIMKESGADRIVMPLELNSRELNEKDCRGQELIVYGHLPMMISAQCIKKTLKNCDRQKEVLLLKDRTQKRMPVKNHCTFCYNVLYNASFLSLLGQEEMVKSLNPAALRLQFTVESPEKIRQIVQCFSECFFDGKKTELPFSDYTTGHIKRGVL